MATVSRAPLNLTIALFILALSRLLRSYRNFFPRCAWRAGESFDCTRGTTPTHIPRTLRLVWSAHCLFQAGLPTDPSIVGVVQHPGPHAPLLFLLRLRLVESLSASLEGTLPPPELPTNCPQHSLFNVSWLWRPQSSALQEALMP